MKKAYFKNNQVGALPIIVTVLLLVILSVITIASSNSIRENLFATLFPKAASYPTDTQTMKVLVLAYYPIDSNDRDLNPLATGMSTPLVDIKNHVKNITDQALLQLTNGTKFRGYKNASSAAAINYQVVNNKEYREALPVSNNPVPWNTNVFRPDYQQILTRENICDYVDNQNVQQVWLWGYHFGKIEPAESNMAMGTNVQSYWNKTGYGDVSNSELTNDMPTCRNTYTLYNYNYARGLGEVLEDHGHQIEAVMRFVDGAMWEKFQKPNGALNNTTNHCGWTHSPPNSGDWFGDRGQYDWNDKTVVKSDCEDWKPDGGGVVKDVNCNTWYEPFYAKSYATEQCQDDMGTAFKIWWMQNIPGLNNGLTSQNYLLRNWWDFYSNFDQAIVIKKSLVSDQPLPTPTPVPKVRVISPNGGETLIVGEKVTIRWEGDSTRTGYQISYRTSSGVSGSITQITNAAINSYEWTVPNIQNMRVGDSRQVKIEIYTYPAGPGNEDTSDNFFNVSNLDPNADADQDGFSNAKEQWLGTKFNQKCAQNASDHAWPADINNDTFINGGDVSTLVPYIKKEKPYNKRYDLNQDGQITVTDVDALVPFFLQACTDASSGIPDPTQSLSPEMQTMLKSLQPVETPKPTPVGPITKIFQINSSSDNLNEMNNALDPQYSPGNQEVWLGMRGASSSFTGLRFNNMSIPKNAKIKSAKLEVYSVKAQASALVLLINGEKSLNSAAFSATSLPSKRLKTTALESVNSFTPWTANTWYELGATRRDMTQIVQEIVSQPGWQSGNSLSFIIQGAGRNYIRYVNSFSRNPQLAPKLTVVYEP